MSRSSDDGGAGTSDDPATGDEPKRASRAEADVDDKPTPRGSLARALEHPVISSLAIAAVLAAVAFGSGAVPRAYDSVRDTFRSYESRQVDDLKEGIEERPYWDGEPRLLEDSFTLVEMFATTYGVLGNPPIATVEDDRPLYAYPEEINADVYRFDGYPIYLVGQVASVEPVADNDFTSKELRVEGPNADGFVYAAVSTGVSDNYVEGDVVVLRGFAVAAGRVESSDTPVAYFAAIDDENYLVDGDYFDKVIDEFRAR